jgi:hypothetical protein
VCERRWKPWRIELRLLAVLVAASGPVAHGQATGTVTGVVTDTGGRAISGAAVKAGLGQWTATDDSGRFRIVDVRAGRALLELTKLGFNPTSRPIMVIADSTSALIIRMVPVTTLPSVEVTAEPRLARTGFYDRQRLGTGSYVTPARIDSMAKFVMRPSEFLRDTRGIIVNCARYPCAITSRRGDCLNIFVNGRHVPNLTLDEVTALTEIYAIEVYERGSLVPSDFITKPVSVVNKYKMIRTTRCGAIAAWTRLYAGPRK